MMNPPNPDGTPQIATLDEVLETFTELMRGEKSAERLKAAEQLAKYHSQIPAKEGEDDPSASAAEVEAAVAAILAERNGNAQSGA